MRIEKQSGKKPGDKAQERKRRKLSPMATTSNEVVDFNADKVLIRRRKDLERTLPDTVVNPPILEPRRALEHSKTTAHSPCTAQGSRLPPEETDKATTSSSDPPSSS